MGTAEDSAAKRWRARGAEWRHLPRCWKPGRARFDEWTNHEKPDDMARDRGDMHPPKLPIIPLSPLTSVCSTYGVLILLEWWTMSIQCKYLLAKGLVKRYLNGTLTVHHG